LAYGVCASTGRIFVSNNGIGPPIKISLEIIISVELRKEILGKILNERKPSFCTANSTQISENMRTHVRIHDSVMEHIKTVCALRSHMKQLLF
jgi:hypothetical protein